MHLYAGQCTGSFLDFSTEPDRDSCVTQCKDYTNDCQYWTFDSSSGFCSLYTTCEELHECPTCTSGQKECKSARAACTYLSNTDDELEGGERPGCHRSGWQVPVSFHIVKMPVPGSLKSTVGWETNWRTTNAVVWASEKKHSYVSGGWKVSLGKDNETSGLLQVVWPWLQNHRVGAASWVHITLYPAHQHPLYQIPL